MITLRFIDDHRKTFGRTHVFKTLAGARTRAHRLVGLNPKRDPDGYVSHRTTGNCLFFQGCTYDELFLDDTQRAFLATLDPSPDRWTEVLTEEHVTAAALERREVIVIRRIDERYWEARRS